MNTEEPNVYIDVVDQNASVTIYKVDQYFVFKAWNNDRGDISYIGFMQGNNLISDSLSHNSGSHLIWILQRVREYHKMEVLLNDF